MARGGKAKILMIIMIINPSPGANGQKKHWRGWTLASSRGVSNRGRAWLSTFTRNVQEVAVMEHMESCQLHRCAFPLGL